MVQKYKTEIAVGIVLLVLFLLTSYFSQKYVSELMQLFGGYGKLGMFFYVVLAMTATIIAPISFLPLIPVAVALWGSLTTAILSIIAWSLGAGVAFLLARRFGKPIGIYFIGEKNMTIFSKLIPQKYIFVAVIFLRMFLPVDMLSYALGLFSDMRFWPYMLATIIGTAPFAFVFSYIVHVNILYQISMFIFGTIILLLCFPYLKKRYHTLFLETHT